MISEAMLALKLKKIPFTQVRVLGPPATGGTPGKPGLRQMQLETDGAEYLLSD